MKLTKILFSLLILVFLFSPFRDADAQKPLLADSVTITTGDSSWYTVPGGLYSSGALTLVGDATGDTVIIMGLYNTGSTYKWIQMPAKYTLDQSTLYDTVWIGASEVWDFEITDPCILGIKVVRIAPTVIAARTTYIYYRLRRDY